MIFDLWVISFVKICNCLLKIIRFLKEFKVVETKMMTHLGQLPLLGQFPMCVCMVVLFVVFGGAFFVGEGYYGHENWLQILE